MIRFLGDLPRRCNIAVSGGPDSMAVLDFMTRNKDRQVCVLHVNHGTEFGDTAVNVVKDFCRKRKISLFDVKLNPNETPKSNKENYWRDKRYEFFEETSVNIPVITCHNLDDCIETWFFGASHGTPKLIPYRRANVIRPFLTTPKSELVKWCENHEVPYLVDPGNSDPVFMRSLIRTEMIPVVRKVNPGIEKVIKRKVEEDFEVKEIVGGVE